MGLLDVFSGMSNGPRGAAGSSRGGGGMSPILLAALGLLAYKAVKHIGDRQAPPASAGAPPPGGGLGEILHNLGLGGAAAGGAGLGGVLSNGLGDLLRQFQGAGQGKVADSWIESGTNMPVQAQELEKVLTPEQIAFLSEKTGMSRDALLEGLSSQLPDIVNQLTPQGRLPAGHELDKMV